MVRALSAKELATPGTRCVFLRSKEYSTYNLRKDNNVTQTKAHLLAFQLRLVLIYRPTVDEGLSKHHEVSQYSIDGYP